MALNFKPLQYEPGGSMYAPRIGEDTWNLYRPQIEQLYIGHGKTLDEVMAAMAHDHNFRPTESQYKIQFRRWRLRKNRVGGVPPPQKAGHLGQSPAGESSSSEPPFQQQPITGTFESPSMSTSTLSPQQTPKTEFSTTLARSPGESVTSWYTDTQATPKGNVANLVPAPADVDVAQVPPLPRLSEDLPVNDAPVPVQSGAELTKQESIDPPTNTLAEDIPVAQVPELDMPEVENEPAPAVNNRISDEGGELNLLTGSLLDALITVACDQQKIVELTDEGCFWLKLVARHLTTVQCNGDPMNASSVILQALFKYKQANVFYPNAKMSTMSVLSEVAPTTDVRDLVQQVGWIYSAKNRTLTERSKQRELKANWLLSRSCLGDLYRMRSQTTEATKLCATSLKTLRGMPSVPDSYAVLVAEQLYRAYEEAGDVQVGKDTKTRLEKHLNESGNGKQLESVKYFYEHCFKLLESATVFAWAGYADFKGFATLLEGLCGPVHWRTTTLFAYFWIRWRENDTRSRTLDNIANIMEMRSHDLIGAFVTLLYSRMPSDFQFPPVQRLFEDAIKAVRILSTEVDLCVPLRKAWFGTFNKYTQLHGDLDPSAPSAIAGRAIAMCLCDPEFSSLRELLSSEKYQRLPNVIPTLSMTPQSSISGFRLNRPGSIEQSNASRMSRSMKDSSSIVDLPSNFMRRSWSSFGSGLLLGQKVSSLRSFYTGKSSKRTRDSKMLERTWDSDEDDEDEDVEMAD